MQSIKYKITTLAPVLISSDSGEINTVSTYKYMSGNSVLGIFASKYIKKQKLSNAHENMIFSDWFLHGKLSFSNAYITTSNDDKTINNYPIPFSIQKEKGSENIYDLLIDDIEDDSIQTKSISGFGRIKNDSIYFESVKQNINFHHAIEDKQIFHYESIAENQVFEGEICGNKEDLDKFIAFYGNNTFKAFIGRSKTAQYGEIIIELGKIIKKENSNDEIESITLISDAVIYNKNGYSSTDIKDLQEYFGSAIKITKSFIKNSSVENFVSIWGLKKYSENTFSAGSCFKLEIKNETGKNLINDLYKTGIGEKTNEGFGKFLINYQSNNELTKRDNKKIEFKKPNFSLPKEAESIIKYSIEKIILERVTLSALLDANNFLENKNKPTQSLIGRLKLILNDSSSLDDFKNKIKKLRKPAKDKLEKFNNGKDTLEDFLNDFDTSKIVNNLKDKGKLEKLLEIINYRPIEDEKFISIAFKVYFNSFFTSLMKNKKEGVDNE